MKVTFLNLTNMLKNGEEVPSDVLLCGTGWLSSFDYFDSDLLVHLGLPHSLKDEPAEDAETWSGLEKQADLEILDQFPLLAIPPEHPRKPIQKTPFRLYNGIAPLRDDSIAFIGYVILSNYFPGVECQAIWATAYLDKHLALPSLKNMQAEVARVNTFCRRRYLSSSELGNYLPFESIRYTDKLLREAGFSSHRNGWFKDNFVPSTSRYLAGLKNEYIAKYGSDVSKPGE